MSAADEDPADDDTVRGRGEHYFSARPAVTSRPGTVALTVLGGTLTLRTDRGTFSPDRLDPGTALLLDRAPPPPGEGRFVDLGCGYGPIACSLATLAPASTIDAVDVNRRALELCAANARSAGLDNVRTYEPDDVPPGPIDLIWSNPPIRIGKAALHELLATWLGRLAPGGSAVLVVNRHLGADSLQRWLGDQGFLTERLASKRGYRLLGVRPASGLR